MSRFDSVLVDSLGRRFQVQRIAAGVYVDEHEQLHLIIGELLRAHGYADTLENRDTVVAVAREIIRQAWPDIRIDEAAL